uniref:Zn(2)-C6 fungal-type domain-containing protein n=1 Tax=Vannella robusta TaxID=1487602 RepID=A0A7S4MP05_9EUKA|mmetsp:Transcript_5070/g.6178  ORF Transcript_5070/g.6178 Transcript_5070/m.6178 type:complete len:450 (+) Transcript_5070:87-1436(+)
MSAATLSIGAKRACFHCKKAKTSCSNERPCSRCVRLGLTDTCIDTPRSDINEEEKKLWEQTLQYLTEHKPSGDKEEKNLRQMVAKFARRASGETNLSTKQSEQNSATTTIANVPPSFLVEPNKFNSFSGDQFAVIEQSNPQAEYLAQQNEILAQQVQSLLQQLERNKEQSRTFYNFSILTTYGDVAYSRWSYPAHSLLDYNRGFLELSRRSPAELQPNKFNIRQLHHEKHILSCSAALYLLSQGLVEYIEMNQEWWTPAGTIPVKTYINVNLDEHEQTGEVILFSKRSSVPLPQDTLFLPLDIGLSKKAKSQNLDLKQAYGVQNYLPMLMNECVKDPEKPRPYKIPREKGEQISQDNSSYSMSPPGLSPNHSIPSPLSCSPNTEAAVTELGEESLSFLESLADPNFTEFPEFTDMVQSMDPSITGESIDSILGSDNSDQLHNLAVVSPP